MPVVTRCRSAAGVRCALIAAAWFASGMLLTVGPAFAQVGGQVGGGAGREGGDRVPRPDQRDLPGEEEAWQARFQTTFVWQGKGAFPALYSGVNSLSPVREGSHTWTATGMFGWRPWAGGELYLNPEIALGVPLSQLRGLGGFTNGEAARTSGATPTLYVARAFVRQTWGFGGDALHVASDQNQLAGTVAARRLVLTAGAMSVIDLFDDNTYSHDARTQFMNWSLITHGAFDFAADARGYTRGVALEWYDGDWAIRVGRFAMPTESNGTRLQHSLARSYGDQIEIERGWSLGTEPGKARLLMFRNRAVMGSFQDALDRAALTGTTPDLAQVRRDQAKQGFGINLEQRFATSFGAFVRVSRNDGRNEAFAFTEIDRSVSIGLVADGGAWARPTDAFGIAGARNGLSDSHARYLAAGGLGFFLGDGRLNYRPEQVLETYYSMGIAARVWVSVNAQHITNPGYNADRGPAWVVGLRLHTNF